MSNTPDEAFDERKTDPEIEISTQPVPTPAATPEPATPARAQSREEEDRKPTQDPDHHGHQRVRIPITDKGRTPPAPHRPDNSDTWKMYVQRTVEVLIVFVVAALATALADRALQRSKTSPQKPTQPLVAKPEPWRAVFTEAQALEALRQRGLTEEPGNSGRETADPRQLTQLNSAFPFQYPEHTQPQTNDHQLRIASVRLENGRVFFTLTDIAMGPGRGQQEPRTERTYKFDQRGNPIHRQKGDLSIAQQEALWSFIAPKD